MNFDIVLARALIDALLFLEFSSDGVLDSDASVAQLEALANILRNLDNSSRDRFVALCQEISLEYNEADDELEFVQNIPEDFGLFD